MYNLALFSSINFVPYERKVTQKESFQTTYVRRTSMQKTINCVIPKRLFGSFVKLLASDMTSVKVAYQYNFGFDKIVHTIPNLLDLDIEIIQNHEQ